MQSQSLAASEPFAVSKLRDILQKNAGAFKKTGSSFEATLSQIANDDPDLANVILGKINESNKHRPERLGQIMSSFQRFKGTHFKEFLQVISEEQAESLTKKMSALNVSAETYDNITRAFTLVIPEFRDVLVSALLHEKSESATVESYAAVLQDQLIVLTDINSKFLNTIQLLARTSALGKKRSGLDQLKVICNHIPLPLIPPLVEALNSHQGIETQANAVYALRDCLIALGKTYSGIPDVKTNSELFCCNFQEIVDSIVSIFHLHPTRYGKIQEIVVNACESLQKQGAAITIADINTFSESLDKWFGIESFPNIIFGKTMACLAEELPTFEQGLDAVKMLQRGKFSETETWQIEQMMERLSAVPAKRKGQRETRNVSDNLESWIATTLRTLGRNGMQQPAFQEWLFAEDTGLKPFLKAYGYRPSGERLSDIIANLEQFYVRARVGQTPSGFNEENFWARSGWRARRVLNVITSLLKNSKASDAHEIVTTIEGSAKDFFRIFREATAANSEKRSAPSKAELDRAESRYSDAIQTAVNTSHGTWILSHVAAVHAAGIPVDATSNQFRSGLNAITRKITRLLDSCATVEEREEIGKLFRNEIEKKFSLKNLEGLLNTPDAPSIQRAQVAILYFIAPSTSFRPKDLVTAEDVKSALQCASIALNTVRSRKFPPEIMQLIKEVCATTERKSALQLLGSLLEKYKDPKDYNHLSALLTYVITGKLTTEVIQKNRDIVLAFQRSVEAVSLQQQSDILSLVLAKDIFAGKSVEQIQHIGQILTNQCDHNLDQKSIEAIILLIAKYNKKFDDVDILAISEKWCDAYSPEQAKNVIGCLDLLLSHLDKKSKGNVTELLGCLPQYIKIADIEPFVAWLTTFKSESILEFIEAIQLTSRLPEEWLVLKRFGGFTEWELLPTPMLRQLIGGDSKSASGQIISVKNISQKTLEIPLQVPLFRQHLPASIILPIKDALPIISKAKGGKETSSVEAFRSWCVQRVVDYRWRLVTRREPDDRADLVVQTLIGLSAFPQKGEAKDLLIQSIVKLAPVWSFETQNKESIARLTAEELISILEEHGLEELGHLSDAILDYAIKITGARPLAYYHQHAEKFESDQEYLDEVLEQYRQAAGRRKEKTAPAIADIEERASEDFGTRLSNAYTAGKPAAETTSMGGFHGPSETEILGIQLRNKIKLTSARHQNDMMTLEEAIAIIQSDLRLIVSRDKRDLESFVTLIEVALPLFLEGVQEKRFPALVARFIDQDLPEMLSLDAETSQRKFRHEPRGLNLRDEESTAAIKDREFLRQVQQTLANRIGVTFLTVTQATEEGGAQSRAFNSMTSDLDQRIAELLSEYWSRSLGEMPTVEDILLDTLEELKSSPKGYETVLRGAMGPLIMERYQDFNRVLGQALPNPNVSSVVYLTSVVKDILRSKLKGHLEDADCFIPELFNKVRSELLSVVGASEAQLKLTIEHYNQKYSTETEVFEVVGDLREKLLTYYHSSESRKLKKKTHARLFLISDTKTQNPLFLIEKRTRETGCLARVTPMLTGKNKSTLSSLIREVQALK